MTLCKRLHWIKSINTLSDTLLSVKWNNINIVKFHNNRSSTHTDISLCKYHKIQNGHQLAILYCKVSILSYTIHSVDRKTILKFHNSSSTCRDISLCRYYKIQNGRQSATLGRKVSILSYTLHSIDRNNI